MERKWYHFTWAQSLLSRQRPGANGSEGSGNETLGETRILNKDIIKYINKIFLQ